MKKIWIMVMGLVVGMPFWGWGGDFVREAIPNRWIEGMMPEEMPEVRYPSYFNELDKARAQAFSGRYKLALQTLRGVKEGDAVEVGIVRGSALMSLGRLGEAMEVLSDAKIADAAKVQVLRARVLGERGEYEGAIAVLKEYLAKNPGSIEGHYYLGEMCEKVGDLAGARGAYGWFNEKPQSFLEKWAGNKERGFENAEQVVLIGRAMDRLATLTGAYQNNRGLHDVILSMFVRAYDVIDRGYWPAHVAAAEYFLSHDDEEEAGRELKAALEGNPRNIKTIGLAGGVAVGNYDFDLADQAIEMMREVDRDSAEADLLEARNLMQQRKAGDAEEVLRRVLKNRPRDLEAMGLLAAVYALQVKEEKSAAVLKEVEKIDPNNASAYLEVAEQLGAMRQYPRAAAMYKIAIDRAPWWTAARNGLGLLYTQSGDEDDARAVLEAARILNPFNLRTTNYLRLLDEMAGFAKKESAHFIVLYDAKEDGVVGEYFPKYLESIYGEVCGEYRHEPGVKTIIEVFPTHDRFSVRTTGSPWIGTVGASTGRVIALVAPRKGKETMGTFNWAQVLRHEFTHTVTLSATDNRITHWMTEGLAVGEERSPLQWEWVPTLYRAVKERELFSMDALTWAFVRPRRPEDRSLAYAESFWVCQYIREKYGQEAILKMMAEFKQGERQEEVFPKVLGKSMGDFTAEFFTWAGKQVATWGYDAETTKKYEELKAKGEEMVKGRRYGEAVVVWEEAGKLRPMDPLPHQRLAGLYLTKDAKNPEKAVEHLVALSRVEIKDNRYAKRIARIYRDEGRMEEAAKYAQKSVYIDPYDEEARELLKAVGGR